MTPTARTAVVLVAAGAGTRVGATTNKVLLPLLGSPVLSWSLRTVCSLAYVAHVVVVVRPEDTDAVASLVHAELREGHRATLVDGGKTRHDSERRGLEALRDDIEAGLVEVVAVHDAARPLADAVLFDAVTRVALEEGGAVPVRTQHAVVTAAGDRHVRGLAGMQTPQAFRAGPLLEAYDLAALDGFSATDTAGCVAAYTALSVRAVPAPATNIKVTFPDDVLLAERLLRAR